MGPMDTTYVIEFSYARSTTEVEMLGMDYPSKATEKGIPPLAYQILTTTGGVAVIWCIFHHVWYVLGGVGFALGLTLLDYKCNGPRSVREHCHSLKYLFVIVGGSVSTWLVSNHPWYVVTGAVSAAATNWWDFTMTYSAEFPSLFLSVGVGSHGYTQWILFNYVWSRYLLFALLVGVFIVRVHDGFVDYYSRAIVGGFAAGVLWLLVNYSFSRYVLFGVAFASVASWANHKPITLTRSCLIAGAVGGICWLLLHHSLSWYFFLGYCLAVAIRSMTTTPDMAFWFIAGGGGAATLWLLVNDTWFFAVGLVIAGASALMASFDENDFPLYTFWLFTGIGSMSTWIFFNYSVGIISSAWDGLWHYVDNIWTLYIILGALTFLSAVNSLKMKGGPAAACAGGALSAVYIFLNFSWPRYSLLGMLVAGYVGGTVNDIQKFPTSSFLLTAVGAGGIPWLLMNDHVSVIVALSLAVGVCIFLALHIILRKLGGTNLVMTGLVLYLIVFHAMSSDSSLTACSSLGEVAKQTCLQNVYSW
ncbi:hypothetical protein Mapa_010423 [Marchantia paleacea]|nr:hypothetical protein Mapa_010423 [Marchantia paleacea]